MSSEQHQLEAAIHALEAQRALLGDAVVDAAFLGTGTWEVEIAARRYPALASMRPLFDPDNAKIKA